MHWEVPLLEKVSSFQIVYLHKFSAVNACSSSDRNGKPVSYVVLRLLHTDTVFILRQKNPPYKFIPTVIFTHFTVLITSEVNRLKYYTLKYFHWYSDKNKGQI